MIYEELIRDFADRTQKNLKFIENRAEQEKRRPFDEKQVFETTQLINSMLGLLVFPVENYYEQIPSTRLRELENYGGFPRIQITKGQNLCTNFKQLVKRLRHGVAHCNLEFTANGSEITGLKVWNTDEADRSVKIWVIHLTLNDLREITGVLLDTLEEQFRARSSQP